jgi:hypothetical protein
MRTVALLCCGWLSLGCSFLFVRPPPSEHAQLPYFDCASSAAAPATDVTWAVIGGLGAIGASVDDPNTDGDQRSPGLARGFGVLALASAASAVYGFIVSSHCDSAKEELAARVLKRQQEYESLLHAPRPIACHRDVECKAQRLCVNSTCVDPPAAPPGAPAAAPAPAAAAAPGAPPAPPTGVLPPPPPSPAPK